MTKTLKLSFLAAVSLQAAEPMVPESMSTDRGGVKSAIDAYSDGGGAYLFDDKGRAAYDNSPMNNLVFKYGADAKDSGASLRDQVKTLSPSTADEKLLADKIPSSLASINPPDDGTVCNDFDPKTIDDIFTAGVCRGTNVEGQSCDDNNVQTIDDKYVSGVCVGNNVEGQACDDKNAQTINDKYVSGICLGTNVEGQSCNDNNTQTIDDKYNNGVCSGRTAYSCLELKNNGNNTSGFYYINTNPAAPNSFRVYCDMVTDGGGWTSITSKSVLSSVAYAQTINNFYTGGTYDIGVNNFLNNFTFTIAKLEFYANPGNTQKAVFYKSITKNNVLSWFAYSGYEKEATKTCTDVALTANCTTKGFDHDYANDGISSTDGSTIMMWGADIAKHGYAKINYHPFHSTSTHVGYCSTTGGLNNNAWSDIAEDGHWGNGLSIWFR